MANLVTNVGYAVVSDLLTGAGLIPQYGAWGTGAGTSAVTDTSLFTEVYCTTNNGSDNTRPAAMLSQVMTSVTNDTYQAVVTLTAAASNAPLAITNAGLFTAIGTSSSLTTNTSGPTLFCHSDFSVVNLNAGDSITFTFKIQVS